MADDPRRQKARRVKNHEPPAFGVLNAILLILMIVMINGLIWLDCGPYLAWLIRLAFGD